MRFFKRRDSAKKSRVWVTATNLLKKNSWAVIWFLIAVNISLCAAAAYPIDVSGFMTQRNIIFRGHQQDFEALLKRQETQLHPDALPQTNAESPQAADVPSPLRTCDCEDESLTANQSTSNFLYGPDQRKTYRIRPYCKCLQPDPSLVGVIPPGRTGAQGSDTGSYPVTSVKDQDPKGSRPIVWNIQY